MLKTVQMSLIICVTVMMLFTGFAHSFQESATDIVLQTSDDGIINIAATPDESGIQIVKTNSAGDIVWQKRYQFQLKSILFSTVHQTGDGGYFLTGDAEPNADINSDEWDFWMIKLDEKGLLQWGKNYGRRKASSIIEDGSGGYIFAGCAGMDNCYSLIMRD